MKIFFNSSENQDAKIALNYFVKKYGQCNIEKAEIIVPITNLKYLFMV